MAVARKTAAKKKVATKPAPEVEVELDEVEEDEVEETAPKAKKKAAGQEEVTFGVADLAELLSEGQDKKVTTRELRTLIRKMARDGKGRVNREIIPGNRARYNWSGPNDPEVKAIIKAFNAGELEQDKQEKLQALKERKAAQRAAKEAEAAAAEGDDEELELEDE